MTYTTNIKLPEIAAAIRAAKNVVLTTHAKPDGDAIGSVLAMARMLTTLYIDHAIYLMGPLPANLAAMLGMQDVNLVEDTGEPDFEPDLIIITDTGARSQLDPLTLWLEDRRERIIILDHHMNGDFGECRKNINPKCASVTQLLIALFDELGIEITGGNFSIAEALFLGMATDTGWFKFNNADEKTFRAAARLIEAGADKSRIFALIEENDRPERLAMIARTLDSIEYVNDGAAAIMTVTQQDFKETGGEPEDMVGIVNEPMRIGCVRMSVLLTEIDATLTKLSFRSKPAIETTSGIIPAIDVNQLAGHFGGGGHIHAAGAKSPNDLDTTKHQLRSILQRELS